MSCSAAARTRHPMPVTPSKRRACTEANPWWAFPTARAGNDGHSPPDASRRALTLIELLLTLAVLGILAAVLIPQLSGDLPERLSAAAQVVSADLDYARSLAVSNNTKYQITFNKAANEYTLR